MVLAKLLDCSDSLFDQLRELLLFKRNNFPGELQVSEAQLDANHAHFAGELRNNVLCVVLLSPFFCIHHQLLRGHNLVFSVLCSHVELFQIFSCNLYIFWLLFLLLIAFFVLTLVQTLLTAGQIIRHYPFPFRFYNELAF